MTERTRNIIVGLTALIGLAAFLFMLTLFGYVPSWIEQGYKVSVSLPTAGGLGSGSRVMFMGLDVGSIRAVNLQQDGRPVVVVTAAIREDVNIPAAARAKVETLSILGGTPTLTFDVSGLKAEQLGAYAPKDGSAQFVGDVPSFMGAIASQMQAAMGNPAEKFQQLADQFTALSTTWQQVGEDLHQLFESRDPAQVDAGQATPNLSTVIGRTDARMAQLKELMTKADQRLAEMQDVITGVKQWVNDPQMRENLRATLANAAKTSEKMSSGADEARALIKSTQTHFDTLTKRYVAVADDLSGAIASLRKTLEQARTGEGTVGKLLNDPGLYNNLNDAVQRLDGAIKEFRLLIEKWKAEGLPVQF